MAFNGGYRREARVNLMRKESMISLFTSIQNQKW
jgi:hypothetical protein